MRTEKEIKNRIKQEKDPNVKAALKWALETCNTCKGQGTIMKECGECGEVRMCNCNGSLHEYGMGCL